MSKPLPPESIQRKLLGGTAIPAHPLALTEDRRFDEKYQRALTRYYAESGAGGIAVGVHSTQFEIRLPEIGLYQPVLELAAETLSATEAKTGQELIRVAGIAGGTEQAIKEAELAAGLGYHIALVSLAAFKESSNAELIAHLDAVSDVIPIFGFYLQPAVGGRKLDYDFWRAAAEIENLLAIKTAPFNRYDTIDVARALADSGRADSIALYTGNDDNILLDLLTTYQFAADGPSVSFRGGLLGQWAVWTQRAAQDFEFIKTLKADDQPIPQWWMTRAQQMTDVNAALFDVANGFHGCIPGIHEILRRQGLLRGRWTLNPKEELSPGQMDQIDRVYTAYPDLNDDAFVQANLDRWLS